MDQTKLKILAATIQEQQGLIEAIYRSIAERKKSYSKDRIVLESLAYQLHNLYCAFEELFRVSAKYFDNHVTEEIDWRKELLDRMAFANKDGRPRLISKPAYELLDELHEFRHAFLHTYSVELEAKKIKLVLKKALALKRIYKKDIANFLKQLQVQNNG